MIVLGIDPGYERLGWGVVQKTSVLRYVDCGIIRTSKDLSLQERLVQVADELDAILTKFQPDLAAVEELFSSTNKSTVIPVAQTRGVILHRLAIAKIQTKEYSPSAIKAVVAGDGRADKKAVEKMVRLQLPGVPGKLIDDTLDALAAALCCGVEKNYG